MPWIPVAARLKSPPPPPPPPGPFALRWTGLARRPTTSQPLILPSLSPLFVLYTKETWALFLPHLTLLLSAPRYYVFSLFFSGAPLLFSTVPSPLANAHAQAFFSLRSTRKSAQSPLVRPPHPRGPLATLSARIRGVFLRYPVPSRPDHCVVQREERKKQWWLHNRRRPWVRKSQKGSEQATRHGGLD